MSTQTQFLCSQKQLSWNLKHSKKTKQKPKTFLSSKSYEKEKCANDLPDKEKFQRSLKTLMCYSIYKKEECPHGENCRFAHSLNELNVKDCMFLDKCRFVRMKNGVLCNHDNKICNHKHPQETKQNVFIRTGVYQTTTQLLSSATQPMLLSSQTTSMVEESILVLRVPKRVSIASG